MKDWDSRENGVSLVGPISPIRVLSPTFSRALMPNKPPPPIANKAQYAYRLVKHTPFFIHKDP